MITNIQKKLAMGEYRKIKSIIIKINAIVTYPEMTKIMELANKSIETALGNMLHIFKNVGVGDNYGKDINEKFFKRP